jgi:hypothetical protein
MDLRKLDYTLKTPEERKAVVEEIVKQTPPNQLTEKYMEILSDYIIFAMEKDEKKKKEIITDNRMITINKRETSYQGLVSQFENGEDGLYNITIENDKNVILTPKISISPKDVAEIPALQDLKDAIDVVKEQEKKATGKNKYKLKKTLIEMYQEQYTIKNTVKQPMFTANTVKSFAHSTFEENITIDENGIPQSDCLCSFFNPKHISALLCNYSALKAESEDKFDGDCFYMMIDLENLVDRTLKDDYPLYYDLLIYKIDGRSNAEIQFLLELKYGIKHSVEYISSLWRNKIPKLIAEQEVKDYLDWYYTFKEKGQWKKCSRCGQVKLAHNLYFSKNKTAKDGFYSICKDCRNKKNKEGE